EIKELTRSFGGLVALDRVSLQVPTGERRALIGPNGAGKTTLFNCMAGSLSPSSGRISLFGKEVTRLAEHQRTAMGIGRTYQITNVFHESTVIENVILAAQGTSREKWVFYRPVENYAERIKSATEKLSSFQLGHRASHFVHQLSYGERRQLELVLALASRPRVLLLDEPASGLSPAERHKIGEIISRLSRDITVIFIEHDMDVALGIADRVSVLHEGRIILEGTPAEVRANPLVREVYFGNV
ncbi:MAG TPA: ABC transporter ATP-binding protein, partial [Thermodesulfobacteriota bacterium]|nr:ABC transporter ATP-binding protein [Thermodesulfobacteriota bacterium]